MFDFSNFAINTWIIMNFDHNILIFVQFLRGTSTSLDAISDLLAGPYSAVAAAARSDGGVLCFERLSTM